MKPQNQNQELTSFISMVPKHLRHFIKQGIFIVPNSYLIDDYALKKQKYLSCIREIQKPSVNSLHKYTSPSPISLEDVNIINQKIKVPLDKYYSQYLKHYEFNNKNPELFASFGIRYDAGHKGLSYHTDDSIYTINLCLKNEAKGNEVVFSQMLTVEAIQDYALIHSGKVPHHTNELLEGERVNVVLWFK